MRRKLLPVVLVLICILSVAVEVSSAGKDQVGIESTGPVSPESDSITVSLRASADSYVDTTAPDTPRGSWSYLYVVCTQTPPSPAWIQDSFVRFDLEGEIPPAAIIETATLGAYLNYVGLGFAYTHVPIGVYPVAENWFEATLTWNNQPSIGPVTATSTVGYPELDWKEWLVTDLVRWWHDGTLANHGVMLRGPTSCLTGADYGMVFNSSNYEKGPYLDITYRLPPSTDAYLPLVARNPRLGARVFSDDFEDGDLDGWIPSSGSWDNPSVFMQGGRWDASAHNVRSETASDFVYEGDVFLLGGPAAGLAFRSSLDGTASYDVHINAADDVLRITRRSPYTVLAEYNSPIDQAQFYALKVVVQGQWIEAYLDGVKVLEAWDPTYSSGHLGVVTWRTEAIFDNLAAWQLP